MRTRMTTIKGWERRPKAQQGWENREGLTDPSRVCTYSYPRSPTIRFIGDKRWHRAAADEWLEAAEFVYCFEYEHELDMAHAEGCAESTGLDWSRIQSVYHDKTRVQALNALNARQTAQAQGRQGTPWVYVNGAHVEDPNSLLEAVCKAAGSAPAGCKSLL